MAGGLIESEYTQLCAEYPQDFRSVSACVSLEEKCRLTIVVYQEIYQSINKQWKASCIQSLLLQSCPANERWSGSGLHKSRVKKTLQHEGRHKCLLVSFEASLPVCLVAHACTWHQFKKLAVMSASTLMAMFQDGRCLEAVASA